MVAVPHVCVISCLHGAAIAGYLLTAAASQIHGCDNAWRHHLCLDCWSIGEWMLYRGSSCFRDSAEGVSGLHTGGHLLPVTARSHHSKNANRKSLVTVADIAVAAWRQMVSHEPCTI